MKIKNKVKNIILLVITSFIVFILGISWSYKQIDQAMLQNQYAFNILQSVSKLSHSIHYIFGQNDIKNKHSREWEIEQQIFQTSLLNKPRFSPSVNQLVLSIEKKNQGVISLSQQISANNNDHDLSSNLKKHLLEKLFVQMEGIREGSFRVLSISQEYIRELILLQIFIVLTISLSITIILFLFSKGLSSQIGKQLNILLMGTKQAKEGDFKHRLKGYKDDEFGEVAEGFNLMLSNLKEVTIRRDELQAEVDKRTLALKTLSETDALTDVPNRRAYERHFQNDFSMAKRTNEQLSILMIDIDFFKQFNDNYGHNKGDVVLKKVAKSIENGLSRETDFTARFGGEEFVVTLYDTDIENALQIAEQIREEINQLRIEHNHSAISEYLTISIGVSSLKKEHQDKEELFEEADKALYHSKVSGRNRSTRYK